MKESSKILNFTRVNLITVYSISCQFRGKYLFCAEIDIGGFTSATWQMLDYRTDAS